MSGHQGRNHMPVRFDALSEGPFVVGLCHDWVSTFCKSSDDCRICLGKGGKLMNTHFFNDGGSIFKLSTSDTIVYQDVIDMSVGLQAIRDHISEPLVQARAVACLGMCHQDGGIVEYIRPISKFGVRRKMVVKIS